MLSTVIPAVGAGRLGLAHHVLDFYPKMKFLVSTEVPAPGTDLSDAFLMLVCVNESISSAVCIRSVTGKTTVVLNVIQTNKLLCRSRPWLCGAGAGEGGG